MKDKKNKIKNKEIKIQQIRIKAKDKATQEVKIFKVNSRVVGKTLKQTLN